MQSAQYLDVVSLGSHSPSSASVISDFTFPTAVFRETFQRKFDHQNASGFSEAWVNIMNPETNPEGFARSAPETALSGQNSAGPAPGLMLLSYSRGLRRSQSMIFSPCSYYSSFRAEPELSGRRSTAPPSYNSHESITQTPPSRDLLVPKFVESVYDHYMPILNNLRVAEDRILEGLMSLEALSLPDEESTAQGLRWRRFSLWILRRFAKRRNEKPAERFVAPRTRWSWRTVFQRHRPGACFRTRKTTIRRTHARRVRSLNA